MPSNPLSSLHSSARRTGSARQRENRGQTVMSSVGSGRRRNARSPDTRPLEEVALTRNDSSSSRKKKRPNLIASTSAPSEPLHRLSVGENSTDRGRKGKAKPRSQLFLVEDIADLDLRDVEANGSSGPSRSKRKERSKSRETQNRTAWRIASSPEPPETDFEQPPAYSGPEYVRMRNEIEVLKKQLSRSKKTITSQSQEIDRLRIEAANAGRVEKEHIQEIESLKNRSRKSEELVTGIEGNLTCQICMDVFSRPHGLSPCGHVLCQGCLQDWFRAAPSAEDDMMDEDDPDSLIYRKKTCPCCRSVVSSRPIPLFVVKSISSLLAKTKTLPNSPRQATPPPEDDPWAGIFADTHSDDYHDHWSVDGDDDDDEDDDYDEEDDDWSYDGDGYGTDEDNHYEGPYVHPRWAPPSVHVNREDYPNDEVGEELRMLQRGATMQMIDLFAMQYSHETGLCANIENGNSIYLGWNIYLHPDDETGEDFIDYVTADMVERPERWEVQEERDGRWTAWKLVPDIGDEEDYDTSDSEIWLAELAADED